MADARPPIEGYGELARQALVHPQWPETTQPKPRSLAALFSKLDRCIELDWLAERDAVQRSLALVLGCSLSALRAPLVAAAQAPTTTRVRLDDVPFARPLDLREEGLPPGLPDVVSRPGQWTRTWWVAPAGSGRSLVGHWLAARGLAQFERRPAWVPNLAVPRPGALFLEVERPEGLAELAARPPCDTLCVAAPTPPPLPAADGQPWVVVHSPAPSSIVSQLTQWIADRLPEDGSFNAEAAAQWLAEPIEEGLLTTFGSVLGAAGLLDTVGMTAARGRRLTELAEDFVSGRLEEASGKGSAEAQWLKQFGYDSLVRLAQAVLTGDDLPWEAARSQDEWIALVPGELQQSVDAQWVRWSLSQAAGQTTVRDLERAMRNVPPGAYRIVQALVDARLLTRRTASGHLGITPEFLKQSTLVRARQLLVADASPFGWGEALLRPHAAPDIARALFKRLQQEDFGPVEGLLELDLDGQPGLVVALEACFVGLGLRALSGADTPSEVVEAVWNEQLALVLELPGRLPRPRLVCHCGTAVLGGPVSEPLWHVAALALAELLGDKAGAPHPLLRPWLAQSPQHELTLLLDGIHAEAVRCGDTPEEAWGPEAFALAGRLLSAGALPSDPELAHPLARPAVLVREVLSGRVSWPLIASLGQSQVEMRALQGECQRRRVAWPRLARALWQSFCSAECPASGAGLLGPRSEYAASLWPHIPTEHLPRVLSHWADDAEQFPYAVFELAHWEAVADHIVVNAQTPPGAARETRWLSAFASIPASCAERIVAAGALNAPDSAALMHLLWQRWPALMHQQVRGEASDASALQLDALLCSAPSSEEAAVMASLAEGLARRDASSAAIDTARRWLHGRVMARSAQWRSAYTHLQQLEDRVSRSRRASGRPGFLAPKGRRD